MVIVTLISLKLKIPSSISQSVIFSLIGFSIVEGLKIDFELFLNLIYFWIATPFIAFLISIFFCWIINLMFNFLKLNVFQIDYQIRLSLIIFGCTLSAFALGAHLTCDSRYLFSVFKFKFRNFKFLFNFR